jgi:hypothetical protein
MSNTIKTISDSEMKELMKAYVEYKKAESKFKRLKEKFTNDLMLGVYETKYGKINKFESKRMLLNSTRLAEEHPEVIELMEDYKEEKTQISVTLTNYMD